MIRIRIVAAAGLAAFLALAVYLFWFQIVCAEYWEERVSLRSISLQVLPILEALFERPTAACWRATRRSSTSR